MANNLIEVKKSGRGVIMGGVMYIHKLTQAHTHTHTESCTKTHTGSFINITHRFGGGGSEEQVQFTAADTASHCRRRACLV